MKKKENPLPRDILDHARELRKGRTDAEAFLWELLRDRRFCGKKFRRQHPLGRYIVDFYCHESGLVIELDGGQHGTAAAANHDDMRTRWLNAQGIRVFRFWNHEIWQETDAVLETLWDALTTAPPPSPKPSPRGRGLS